MVARGGIKPLGGQVSFGSKSIHYQMIEHIEPMRRKKFSLRTKRQTPRADKCAGCLPPLGLVLRGLLTNTELFDHGAVAVDIFFLQIIKKISPLTYQFE